MSLLILGGLVERILVAFLVLFFIEDNFEHVGSIELRRDTVIRQICFI